MGRQDLASSLPAGAGQTASGIHIGFIFELPEGMMPPASQMLDQMLDVRPSAYKLDPANPALQSGTQAITEKTCCMFHWPWQPCILQSVLQYASLRLLPQL